MKAAVTIWCDVAAEVREEFDDWHAHEHMPERLSIPGFLRGSRWVAADGGSGYFMLYEARDESTITAGPYLERLNNPTPWSRKMMPHHRNMAQTTEQKLRGGDLLPDWIALVAGYHAEAVAGLASKELNGVAGIYRLAYILAATEEA